MPKRFLFLDDTKERHEHFDALCKGLDVEIWHVYTAQEAINKVSLCGPFDCVWLDHDLEDTCQDTGQVVAEFIALHLNRDSMPKNVVIHSWNPAGALRMENTLKANCVNVKRVAFSFNR